MLYSLDSFSRVALENEHVGIKQRNEFLRRALERWKRAEVQGQHNLGLEIADSQRCFPGSHGVMPADGNHSHLRMIEFANQVHITEDGRIPCVIEHGAIPDS